MWSSGPPTAPPALRRARRAARAVRSGLTPTHAARWHATKVVEAAAAERAFHEAPLELLRSTRHLCGGPSHAAELLAGLVRELSGGPGRPASLDPGWITPAVLTLVGAAYTERDMPSGTLDPARLAVLSDALEEAGCTDASLLGHLRGEGPHWRGCHALDAVLGRS